MKDIYANMTHEQRKALVERAGKDWMKYRKRKLSRIKKKRQYMPDALPYVETPLLKG